MTSWLGGLIIAVLTALPAILPAQTASVTSSRVVRSVGMQLKGTVEATGVEARKLISTRKGEVLDELRLDRDIRAMYRTGLFRSVHVLRSEVSLSEVDLVFIAEMRPHISAVRIDAAEALRHLDPHGQVTTRPGDRLFDHLLAREAANLTEFYVQAGFPNATVTFEYTGDPLTGDVIVQFIVGQDA